MPCLLEVFALGLLIAAGLTLAFAPRDGSVLRRAGRFLFVVALMWLCLGGLMDGMYPLQGGRGWW